MKLQPIVAFVWLISLCFLTSDFVTGIYRSISCMIFGCSCGYLYAKLRILQIKISDLEKNKQNKINFYRD